MEDWSSEGLTSRRACLALFWPGARRSPWASRSGWGRGRGCRSLSQEWCAWCCITSSDPVKAAVRSPRGGARDGHRAPRVLGESELADSGSDFVRENEKGATA